MIHLTRHAIHRYQERVANLPAEVIALTIDTPTVRCAVQFGAPYVKLPSGHRLVIQNGSVVTVLPPMRESWRLGTPKGSACAADPQ